MSKFEFKYTEHDEAKKIYQFLDNGSTWRLLLDFKEFLLMLGYNAEDILKDFKHYVNVFDCSKEENKTKSES